MVNILILYILNFSFRYRTFPFFVSPSNIDRTYSMQTHLYIYIYFRRNWSSAGFLSLRDSLVLISYLRFPRLLSCGNVVDIEKGTIKGTADNLDQGNRTRRYSYASQRRRNGQGFYREILRKEYLSILIIRLNE